MHALYDAAERVVHGTASCTGDRELEIETMDQRWAYAVTIPLVANAPTTGRAVIRLAATVEVGEIGFGLLTPDRSSYAHETFFPADGCEVVVELIASFGEFSTLTIRNASSEGKSKVRLRLLDWRLIPDVPPHDDALFPARIPAGKIIEAVDRARRGYPGRRAVVLADTPRGCAGDPRVDCIDCAVATPGVLTSEKVNESVFVYACEFDDFGSPFVRRISASNGVFLPANVSRPATSFYHQDAAVRRVLTRQKALQEAEGFIKWDTLDFVNILQLIARTAALSGAYVEVGCYRGSSGAVALDYMAERRIARTCWFIDVFDGFHFPAMHTSADQVWAGTHVTEGEAAVRKRLERWQTERGPKVRVVKSDIVADSLPAGLGPVVLANIDVDLYEAVAAGLRKIAPVIVPGGAMIVEDPGHTPLLAGARAALDEFLESADSESFTALYLESGQTVLLKHAVPPAVRA